MKKKQQIYFTVYALLGIGVIASQLLHLDSLQNILKPLLMPCLIFIYIRLHDEKLKQYDYLIISSLFFSMLGDSFLMPYFDIFLAGLSSFLLAHIFYLIAFVPEIAKPIQLSKRISSYLLIGSIFFIGLVFSLFSTLIKAQAPTLLIIAIGIYASVLFSVFLTALFRNKKSHKSYQYIFFGASLFLLSDGLLALNKFVIPLYLSRLWVMGTYTAAQAFIIYGALKRSN